MGGQAEESRKICMEERGRERDSEIVGHCQLPRKMMVGELKIRSNFLRTIFLKPGKILERKIRRSGLRQFE